MSARRSPPSEPLTPEAAYERALGMLARRARTAREIAAELEARGATAEVVEGVLGRLVSQRHVDDAELAGDAAGALLAGRGVAPAAAVERLVARGVHASTAREAVESAREGADERELCRRALERRLRGAGAPSDGKAAARHARALLRLGYEPEVVASVIEQTLGVEPAEGSPPADAGEGSER